MIPGVQVGVRSVGRGDLGPTGAAQRWLSRVIVLLLVSSTVTWRRGVYFSGGVDPVVAAKAGLLLLAIALAVLARKNLSGQRYVGGRTIAFLVLYVGIATFGSVAAGQAGPSLVLGARLLMLGAAIVLLLQAYPPKIVLEAVFFGVAVVGAVAVMTGLLSQDGEERLHGGLPPLHPNELALMSCICLLGLAWLWFEERGRLWHLLVAAAALATLWSSGSRTSLFALAVAVMIMLFMGRTLRPQVAVVGALLMPVAFYLAFFTGMLSSYFERGAENIGTLNARTIAWSAALTFPDTAWERWFGSGLAQRKIPVVGQYWDVQGLDSSWVSALIQGGIAGLILLLVWTCTVLVASFSAAPMLRRLLVPATIFILGRSVLESGLLESSLVFIVWMTVSLLSENATHAAAVGRDGVAELPGNVR